MRCPRCRTTLVATANEGARFERCPACKGLAVGTAVLRSFAPPEHLRAVWQNLPDGRPGAACPSCSNAMTETPVDCRGTRVVVDVCKICQVIWFDASELESFSPDRQAPVRPPRELSPEAAEAAAIATIEARRAEEQTHEETTLAMVLLRVVANVLAAWR